MSDPYLASAVVILEHDRDYWKQRARALMAREERLRVLLREILERASRLAESERAGMTQQVVQEAFDAIDVGRLGTSPMAALDSIIQENDAAQYGDGGVDR